MFNFLKKIFKKNNKLTLKFLRLSENCILPTKAHESDACYDIYSPVDIDLKSNDITKFNLDFSVSCPKGYKLCIYSRSGLASKGILLSNSVGIVDPDYRGCVGVALVNNNNSIYHISKGDRILQMALEKIYSFDIDEVTNKSMLGETERGAGGFGSSGK